MIPLIIFKGKTNNVLYKKLQHLKEVIENKVIIQTQENAWMTENNFSSYIDKVFTKINKEKRRLIIMDHCTSHDTDTISNILKSKNCDIIFIPKRMTNILQPQDRDINFLIKNY